ncbi:hypothetical protein AC578_5625 [Pseudocercospora eumusae]|uniref:Uncharacterized protein n=1 Tax=Pseudocercospora eumusae TaxID=321146 RepID=A0A139HT08_9PEZI|nr:hypothetical protein AC578_5625 [Pseudocercospora eumusae]
MEYHLISVGRGKVLKLADFKCRIFAATDCFDDVAVFIPLGYTHVFIGNIRATVRADQAHEVITLNAAHPDALGVQLRDGMAAHRDAPVHSYPDHTKFNCTQKQGAKLKEVVKRRITQIVESAYPDGLRWMEHPESQQFKQYAAFACFHTTQLFKTGEVKTGELRESRHYTTGGYIMQALYELMHWNSQNYFPAYGFVAQPAKHPYWLSTTNEYHAPIQYPSDFGWTEQLAPNMPLESNLEFIWHETKEEWVTQSEHTQDPPARKKAVRFAI